MLLLWDLKCLPGLLGCFSGCGLMLVENAFRCCSNTLGDLLIKEMLFGAIKDSLISGVK